MIRLLLCMFAVASTFMLVGCESKTYRAETIVHADGSISRAVYQPANETPAAVQQSDAWQQRTYAPRVTQEEWKGEIRQLRENVQDKDRPYFAAWGEFSGTETLPQTFLKAAPEGYPDGTLELDYQREDFVLVVEHRWRESLTDIVALDDMHQARAELADLMIPLAEKILNRGLGDEYDTTEVVDWMHTTLKPIAFELTDVVFDLGARGQLDEDEKIEAAIVPVLSRHGIEVEDRTKRLFDSDADLAGYLRNMLQQKLKRRDGQPVRPAVIREILQWLGLEQVPEGFEKSRRYEEAAQEIVLESYGSKEAFEQQLKSLTYRILGLYRGELLAAPRRFVYTLDMPGSIVETTGTLLSEQRTQFKFSDREAYPFGFDMNCRSLVEQTGVEDQLLGKRVLAQREKMIQYVDLVRENPQLLKAMQECAAIGDLQPLRSKRDELVAAESKQAAEFDRLMELLTEAGD